MTPNQAGRRKMPLHTQMLIGFVVGAVLGIAANLWIGQAGWLDPEGVFHPLGFASVLGQAEGLLSRLPREAAWLYVPGALDGALVKVLVKARHEARFDLIIQSPLSLVMPDEQLKKLFLLKRDIRVLSPLKVAFVAFNPISPAGHAFDSADFRRALARKTRLPLINVLEESL